MGVTACDTTNGVTTGGVVTGGVTAGNGKAQLRRLMSLAAELRARPGATLRQLSLALQVCQRTVRRDLGVLQEVMPVVSLRAAGNLPLGYALAGECVLCQGATRPSSVTVAPDVIAVVGSVGRSLKPVEVCQECNHSRDEHKGFEESTHTCGGFCPGAFCQLCSGEACRTHGHDPCDCDVVQRHERHGA